MIFNLELQISEGELVLCNVQRSIELPVAPEVSSQLQDLGDEEVTVKTINRDSEIPTINATVNVYDGYEDTIDQRDTEEFVNSFIQNLPENSVHWTLEGLTYIANRA